MTEAELEKIMDEYSDLVYTVAASILGRERAPDIEECMSDTFFDIFRSSYEADQIGRNYVITIARRRAVDRLRYIGRHGGSRDEELNEELAEAGFSDDIAETIDKKLLADAVRSLPDKDGEIFTRRYYYGQSVREIARCMSVKAKYVSNRLYLARKALREYLIRKGIEM